jgi:hypothetical protein
MANINPTGLNLTTGQSRQLKTGDTLTDEIGNPVCGATGLYTLPSGATATDLQNALNAYDIVYLQPIDYSSTLILTSAVSIPAGKSLIGTGGTRFDGSLPNQSKIAIGNNGQVRLNGYGRIQSVTLAVTGTPASSIIRMSGSNGNVAYGNQITNSGGSTASSWAIEATGNNYGALISHNIIFGGGTGAGIYISVGQAINICEVSYNVLRDCSAISGLTGTITAAGSAIVMGCVVSNSGGTSSGISFDFSTGQNHLGVVRDCLVDGTSGGGHGFRSTGVSNGSTFANCTVISSSGDGFYCVDSGAAYQGIVFGCRVDTSGVTGTDYTLTGSAWNNVNSYSV